MKKALFGVSLLVLLGLAGWSLVAATGGDTESPDPVPATQVNLEQSDSPPPPSTIAEVVEEVLPSVVNVKVASVQFDPLGNAESGRGHGSGVVIDEEGLILTNNHVVEGATDVDVLFNDGRRLQGTVVGTAPENDIAVVRVDARNLPAVTLGDSDQLRLGDEVIALGFPLRLGGASVTSGIVSAEGRTINPVGAPEPLHSLLQTDAAINPGNSGGALVDLNGRLIGINTAVVPAGAAENIGFAIPVNVAIPVVKDILEHPPAERPWLGVQISDLTPAIAAELDLDPGLEGAVVIGAFPDSPAEAAGIEQGDVIIAVDNREVADGNDLTSALAEHDPGETVAITFIDNGDERVIDVRLATRPSTF